ncbi:MAG: hypothetical protein IKS48_06560 [Eubacterium sp.]|nr:hypothetical protein [Eubacterium sp.]
MKKRNYVLAIALAVMCAMTSCGVGNVDTTNDQGDSVLEVTEDDSIIEEDTEQINDTSDNTIDETIDETTDETIDDTTDGSITGVTDTTDDSETLSDGSYVSTMYINGKYLDSAKAIRDEYSSCITYADLAFFQAKQVGDGEFELSKQPYDLEETVQTLREADVSVIASFGGAYDDGKVYSDENYNEYLKIFKNSSTANLESFAAFLAQTVSNLGLDGIDLDIEIYVSDGEWAEQYVWDNYSYFVQALKRECDSRGLILTTAIDSDSLKLNGKNKISKDALNCFKYINIMSYRDIEDAKGEVEYFADIVNSRRQLVVGQCFWVQDDRLECYSEETLKERCELIKNEYDGRLGGIMFWDFYRDVIKENGKKLTGYVDDYLGSENIYKDR